MGQLKIISLNAKSIRSDSKWHEYVSFLNYNHPDICLVQETNINTTPSTRNAKNYDIYYNLASEEYT